jgi:hypothetical protein
MTIRSSCPETGERLPGLVSDLQMASSTVAAVSSGDHAGHVTSALQ